MPVLGSHDDSEYVATSQLGVTLMTKLWAVFSFCLFSAIAAAQMAAPTPSIDPAQQLYDDVISGRRSPQSLTDDERRLFLQVHGAQSRPQAQFQSRWQSCAGMRDMCREVCEASATLSEAAEALARCAGKHDYSDDCSGKARAVRAAADDYESAVGELADAYDSADDEEAEAYQCL